MTAVNIKRIMGNILRLGGITLKDDSGGLALRNADDTDDVSLTGDDLTATGDLIVGNNISLVSDRRGQALHGATSSRAVWRNVAMMPVISASISISVLNSVLLNLNTPEIVKFPHLLLRYQIGSQRTASGSLAEADGLYIRATTGVGSPITTGYTGIFHFTQYVPGSGSVGSTVGQRNTLPCFGDHYVPGNAYASVGQLGVGYLFFYNWQSGVPYARIATGEYYAQYTTSTASQVRLHGRTAVALNSSASMTGIELSLQNGYNFTPNGKITVYGVHEEVT